MEFKDMLSKRYATKLFQPKAVPDETIRELLEMVQLAPSGLNMQPWRIKVVADDATKARLRAATMPTRGQVTSCSHLLVFCVHTDWAAESERLSQAMKERAIPDMVWEIVMGIADEMAGGCLRTTSRRGSRAGPGLHRRHLRGPRRGRTGARRLPHDALREE